MKRVRKARREIPKQFLPCEGYKILEQRARVQRFGKWLAWTSLVLWIVIVIMTDISLVKANRLIFSLINSAELVALLVWLNLIEHLVNYLSAPYPWGSFAYRVRVMGPDEDWFLYIIKSPNLVTQPVYDKKLEKQIERDSKGKDPALRVRTTIFRREDEDNFEEMSFRVLYTYTGVGLEETIANVLSGPINELASPRMLLEQAIRSIIREMDRSIELTSDAIAKTVMARREELADRTGYFLSGILVLDASNYDGPMIQSLIGVMPEAGKMGP